jgi:hypothetical protein
LKNQIFLRFFSYTLLLIRCFGKVVNARMTFIRPVSWGCVPGRPVQSHWQVFPGLAVYIAWVGGLPRSPGSLCFYIKVPS